MKIKIEKSRCAGHARCITVADALFKLDDTGYIASEGFDVPAGDEQLARRGARACPEQIISIIEE